jgi:hypothetical protein
MAKTLRISIVAVSAVLAVFTLLGLGVTADAGDDVLDPPHLLPYQTEVTEEFTCVECARGPYILQTDAEGRVPENLTFLRVTLDGPDDEDLDLVITTEYGVNAEGRLTAPRGSQVCSSTSYSGDEVCEFDTERELSEIRGQTIYIFVINLTGPPGTTFTLMAEWEPFGRCEDFPYCKPLDQPPNEAPPGVTLQAGSFRTDEGVFLFGYQVPDQAVLWAVRVRAVEADANVDAYVGRGMLRETDNPRDQALYALTSAQGEEFLILFRPEPGFYWVAVENTTAESQPVEVIAMAVFDIQGLLSGQSVSGQVDTEQGLLPFLRRQLQTNAGFLSATQYHLALSAQDLQLMQRLEISFENQSSADLRLRMRFNRPVELENGLVVSDLSISASAGSTVSFSLSPQLLRALLENGDVYFAVEATQPTGQAFQLTVTTVQPEGTVQLLLDELGSTQLEDSTR